VRFLPQDRVARGFRGDPFGELHPRHHLGAVGAFDPVLVVLALLDDVRDAEDGHRRDHGEDDREADPEAIGKRWTEASSAPT